MKKLVLFGAGKIGRSFIAQLFSKSGYETVFIDINKEIILALNSRKEFEVVIKSDKEERLQITNVRGIILSEEEKVIQEIVSADILAVSVGQQGLSSVIKILAKGIIARYLKDPYLKTDIIIAENLRNAAEYFLHEMPAHLPPHFPIHELIGFIETSIGKMVPLMSEKESMADPLLVYAEPYNTLILDKNGFKNPLPEVKGLDFKNNMKAWVDRKSFIHNLGHAATAYLGYLHNSQLHFTWEVLQNETLYRNIRDTMLQAAMILEIKYPEEFTHQELVEHVDDLLHRFGNKHLGDTVFRIGCDLFRKLGPYDRLAGAIRLGLERNMPVDKILYVLVAGIYFRSTDENGKLYPQDEVFHKRYRHNLELILREVCGFDEEIFGSIYRQAKEINLIILGLG